MTWRSFQEMKNCKLQNASKLRKGLDKVFKEIFIAWIIFEALRSLLKASAFNKEFFWIRTANNFTEQTLFPPIFKQSHFIIKNATQAAIQEREKSNKFNEAQRFYFYAWRFSFPLAPCRIISEQKGATVFLIWELSSFCHFPSSDITKIKRFVRAGDGSLVGRYCNL